MFRQKILSSSVHNSQRTLHLKCCVTVINTRIKTKEIYCSQRRKRMKKNNGARYFATFSAKPEKNLLQICNTIQHRARVTFLPYKLKRINSQKNCVGSLGLGLSRLAPSSSSLGEATEKRPKNSGSFQGFLEFFSAFRLALVFLLN